MSTYWTHAGEFHADEVTGYAICLMAGVVNSLERCSAEEALARRQPGDIVADIGRVYDPEQGFFDHHQGHLPRPDGNYYAAAGLLWKAYGKEAVRRTLADTQITEDQVTAIVERVDEEIIAGLDAHDADSSYSVAAAGIEAPVSVMTFPVVLKALIAGLEPARLRWDQGFEEAAGCAARVLRHGISGAAMEVASEAVVAQAPRLLEGAVVDLRGAGEVRWARALAEDPPALWVLIESRHPNNAYALIGVAQGGAGRAVRRKLASRPEGWQGFIHEGQWIAGHDDPVALLALAAANLPDVCAEQADTAAQDWAD